MSRVYNVIDADGHILEPVDIWDNYMDPNSATRRRGSSSKTRAANKSSMSRGKSLGSQQGMGGIGGVGARQGEVNSAEMKYEEGKAGGFDPHERIPDMDSDGIDAAFLYPSMGLFAGAVARPVARGRDVPRLQPLAGRLLQALSRPAVRGGDAADAGCRSRHRGDALRPRELGFKAAFCGRTRITATR